MLSTKKFVCFNDPVSNFFPVVAKNTEDVIEKVARGSGSFRKSTSTGKVTVYGTSGMNTGIFGTTQFILKLKQS